MSDRESWWLEASCRDEPPAIFFPTSSDDTAAAKAICAVCPVKDDCLDYALRHAYLLGIWAGTAEKERRSLRRRRRAA